jgi:hypothetical protein
MQAQPRAKTHHDNLTGISARMQDEDIVKYKDLMKRLKANHGKGFSLSDLIQAITDMNFDQLNEVVSKHKALKAMQDPVLNVIKKLNVSDEAKAKIEAILAEEALKKG